MHMEEVFTAIAVGFEAIGAIAMIIGFLIALVLGLRSLRRGEGGSAAFTVLRTTLGAAILLGLEVLVAADLIRTITSKPSLEDAAILGLIVLIRTILSMSIQIEIEGTLPWRRALLTSGGQLVGKAVGRDRRGRGRDEPPDSPSPGIRVRQAPCGPASSDRPWRRRKGPTMSTDSEQPDGVINANPAGGWDEVGDEGMPRAQRGGQAAMPRPPTPRSC